MKKNKKEDVDEFFVFDETDQTPKNKEAKSSSTYMKEKETTQPYAEKTIQNKAEENNTIKNIIYKFKDGINCTVVYDGSSNEFITKTMN